MTPKHLFSSQSGLGRACANGKRGLAQGWYSAAFRPYQLRFPRLTIRGSIFRFTFCPLVSLVFLGIPEFCDLCHLISRFFQTSTAEIHRTRSGCAQNDRHPRERQARPGGGCASIEGVRRSARLCFNPAGRTTSMPFIGCFKYR